MLSNLRLESIAVEEGMLCYCRSFVDLLEPRLEGDNSFSVDDNQNLPGLKAQVSTLGSSVEGSCVSFEEPAEIVSIFHALSEVKYFVSPFGLTHSLPRMLKKTFTSIRPSAPSWN